MEEVCNEIKETKAKIAVAESNGDIARRNTLDSYLVELQWEKNLLLQTPNILRERICILFVFDEFHLMD